MLIKLKNKNIYTQYLILFFVVYFGVLISGSVNAMAANAMNVRNHHQNRDDSVYTIKQLIKAYNTGVDKGATHMLVVWDKWDFEDSYQFIVFIYPNDDLSAELSYYNTPGYYSLSAVYDIGGKHVSDVKDLQERLIH